MATNKASGWVVSEKGKVPVIMDYEMKPLGNCDVEVEIMASGLCHTDCHMRNNDWGVSTYPMVAGHEGVGKVLAVGSNVKKVKIGQVVGIGWIRDSCGACRNCLKGEENICFSGYTGTFLGDPKNTGSFGRLCRINENFAYPIPEGLDPIKAAPLLCAGMTVYQPLRRYITYPGMHVGVVGIGGLGHMAIKFAHAMGAKVTVFSSSPDKKEEATSMGADNFVVSSDPAQMKAVENSQDFIIDTAPVVINWAQFMACLRYGGVFCLVGVPVDTIPVPTVPLVFHQKTVCGSIVSGGFIMNEMLEFCREKQIYPEVEVWDFNKLPEAMERCLSGKARYRIVLKW